MTTLIHQLTRISYEKGSLKHDDRLDALAIAVAYHVENMAQDAERGIAFEKQSRLDKELEKFMANAVGLEGPSDVRTQGQLGLPKVRPGTRLF